MFFFSFCDWLWRVCRADNLISARLGGWCVFTLLFVDITFRHREINFVWASNPRYLTSIRFLTYNALKLLLNRRGIFGRVFLSTIRKNRPGLATTFCANKTLVSKPSSPSLKWPMCFYAAFRIDNLSALLFNSNLFCRNFHQSIKRGSFLICPCICDTIRTPSLL